MLTNHEIQEIARRQSARDIGCEASDFLRNENTVVRHQLGEGARCYLAEPILAHFVSYGSSVVAAAKDECRAAVEEYLEKFDFYHCFETPNLHWLDARLAAHGHRVCFMAEYFLPDVERMRRLPCPYPTRLLTSKDFAPLYLPQWSNALCAQRRDRDVLGVGAYDGEQLIALAGCSADCADMWQIGIDVLPAYRRRGIAAALTARLALEILARGKIPFYCAAWSNLRSVRTALRAGLSPAWVELTAKPSEFVEKCNG